MLKAYGVFVKLSMCVKLVHKTTMSHLCATLEWRNMEMTWLNFDKEDKY